MVACKSIAPDNANERHSSLLNSIQQHPPSSPSRGVVGPRRILMQARSDLVLGSGMGITSLLVWVQHGLDTCQCWVYAYCTNVSHISGPPQTEAIASAYA